MKRTQQSSHGFKTKKPSPAFKPHKAARTWRPADRGRVVGVHIEGATPVARASSSELRKGRTDVGLPQWAPANCWMVLCVCVCIVPLPKSDHKGRPGAATFQPLIQPSRISGRCMTQQQTDLMIRQAICRIHCHDWQTRYTGVDGHPIYPQQPSKSRSASSIQEF